MEQVELKAIEDIAIQAGAEILDVYHADSSIKVDLKADASPITEADRRAHDYIVKALGALYPNIPILSEESTAIDFEVRRQWALYWLVDPLDGTKEFISRFTVLDLIATFFILFRNYFLNIIKISRIKPFFTFFVIFFAVTNSYD